MRFFFLMMIALGGITGHNHVWAVEPKAWAVENADGADETPQVLGIDIKFFMDGTVPNKEGMPIRKSFPADTSGIQLKDYVMKVFYGNMQDCGFHKTMDADKAYSQNDTLFYMEKIEKSFFNTTAWSDFVNLLTNKEEISTNQIPKENCFQDKVPTIKRELVGTDIYSDTQKRLNSRLLMCGFLVENQESVYKIYKMVKKFVATDQRED